MVRRTKEDAEETRHQLLEAAQRVFAEKGVSRTSLQDIAQAAGVTRGAIYWHFKNKAELFNAMMDSAVLPMEQAMQQIGHDVGQDPLVELERAMLQTMRSIESNARTRAIFEVATLKVEYVDELLAVKQRHVKCYLDGTQPDAAQPGGRCRTARRDSGRAGHRGSAWPACPDGRVDPHLDAGAFCVQTGGGGTDGHSHLPGWAGSATLIA